MCKQQESTGMVPRNFYMHRDCLRPFCTPKAVSQIKRSTCMNIYHFLPIATAQHCIWLLKCSLEEQKFLGFTRKNFFLFYTVGSLIKKNQRDMANVPTWILTLVSWTVRFAQTYTIRGIPSAFQVNFPHMDSNIPSKIRSSNFTVSLIFEDML